MEKNYKLLEMIKIFESEIVISVHMLHSLINFGTWGNNKALSAWKDLM